jgi:hypothetical protein
MRHCVAHERLHARVPGRRRLRDGACCHSATVDRRRRSHSPCRC